MTPLHYFGDWLRDVLGLIPLYVVQIVFVGMPVVLLIWVMRLPKSKTTPPGRESRWDENLKIWAGLALLIQVVVYMLL